MARETYIRALRLLAKQAPQACVSLIPRQAAMANVNRLAQKEKSVVVVWLKIYLIRLLPFPAAELTAQRCKNLTAVSPLGSDVKLFHSRLT
jgi:hypothetical protein